MSSVRKDVNTRGIAGFARAAVMAVRAICADGAMGGVAGKCGDPTRRATCTALAAFAPRAAPAALGGQGLRQECRSVVLRN